MNQAATSRKPPSVLSDKDYQELKRYVIQRTGLAYYVEHDFELGERLDERIAETGLGGCAAYLKRLQDPESGEAEFYELVSGLTIGETYFFRHVEQFNALKEVVFPSILERNRSRRTLRIWSAGCSTGAEVYSLSILLKRDLAEQFKGWQIDIVGTDINIYSLKIAEEGRIADWTLRGVSEELKNTCFTRYDKQWRLKPAYREGIDFQHHNLAADPLPSISRNLFAFDLVLCRNVMIYLSQEALAHLAAGISQCLVDEGWLLIGTSDMNKELAQRFDQVAVPGAVLHRKKIKPVLVSAPAPKEAAAAPATPAEPAERADAEPLPARGDLSEVRRLAGRGEWEAAEHFCERLITQKKLDPLVHYYYSLILFMQGRMDDAESALRAALFLDRKFAPAHYQLGLLLYRRGKHEQALRSLRNARELLVDVPLDMVVIPDDTLTCADLRWAIVVHEEKVNKSWKRNEKKESTGKPSTKG